MTNGFIQVFVTCLLILQSSADIERPCDSLLCYRTAASLADYMDLDVDPCDDFYSFTCGKFLKNFQLPDDKLRISAYQFLEEELHVKLKGVLEDPYLNDDPVFEKITKIFYSSCMNTDSIEGKNTSPLLSVLDRLGGWPILMDDWNDSRNNLTSVLVDLHELGLQELFSMIVYVEESNSTIQLPVIFQPKITFQRDDYIDGLNGMKVNILKTFMTDIFHLLTSNVTDQDKVSQDIDEMLTFEINLSKIVVGPEEMRVKRQELITVENLARRFNETIRFDSYVRGVFKKANITIPSYQLMELYYPSYVEKLPQLLKNTSPRIVINYLLWKAVEDFLPALPVKFNEVKDRFSKSVFGVSGGTYRWRQCLSIMNEIIPDPMGALYVKRHFKSTAKEKMLNLIDELKNSFLNMLSENLWMTDETKDMARQKANAMTEKIGYPDEYLDYNFYNDVLQGVALNSDSFLDNWLILSKRTTIENLKHLQKRFTNTSFLMPVANVNSYYFPNMNSIEFPAGILQYPFFHEEMTMYQNFGGIGYVIGHEIIHGFDDSGRLYNKDGNAVNWWKDEDAIKFVNMSQCFVDRYNGFVVKQINESVNGRLTLGENIADIGGLRETFLAYRSWSSKFGSEPHIPGFAYSPEQLLFIHFGKINCMKTRPEIELHLIKTDNHSPAEFRVNGALMNLREFSETFNCPHGTYMNPVEKCHIW